MSLNLFPINNRDSKLLLLASGVAPIIERFIIEILRIPAPRLREDKLRGNDRSIHWMMNVIPAGAEPAPHSMRGIQYLKNQLSQRIAQLRYNISVFVQTGKNS